MCQSAGMGLFREAVVIFLFPKPYTRHAASAFSVIRSLCDLCALCGLIRSPFPGWFLRLCPEQLDYFFAEIALEEGVDCAVGVKERGRKKKRNASPKGGVRPTMLSPGGLIILLQIYRSATEKI